MKLRTYELEKAHTHVKAFAPLERLERLERLARPSQAGNKPIFTRILFRSDVQEFRFCFLFKPIFPLPGFLLLLLFLLLLMHLPVAFVFGAEHYNNKKKYTYIHISSVCKPSYLCNCGLWFFFYRCCSNSKEMSVLSLQHNNILKWRLLCALVLRVVG